MITEIRGSVRVDLRPLFPASKDSALEEEEKLRSRKRQRADFGFFAKLCVKDSEREREKERERKRERKREREGACRLAELESSNRKKNRSVCKNEKLPLLRNRKKEKQKNEKKYFIDFPLLFESPLLSPSPPL